MGSSFSPFYSVNFTAYLVFYRRFFGIMADDELALTREFPYYDPIYMLPEPGQAWWRAQRSRPRPAEAEVVSIADATG